MTLRRWTGLAALLLAGACGGGADAEAGSGAAADARGVPDAAPARAESVASVPAAEPAATPAPQPASPEPAPTAADSAAAAREDVSPEWKQRERGMGSYADCMEQTKGADAAVRARLEAACARLPGAPR